MTFTIFTDLECNYELQRWQHLHSLSINVTISIVRILFLKHFKAFNSIKEISMTPRACKRDNHEDFLLGKKRQQQTVTRGDSQAGDGDARQVEEGGGPSNPSVRSASKQSKQYWTDTLYCFPLFAFPRFFLSLITAEGSFVGIISKD